MSGGPARLVRELWVLPIRLYQGTLSRLTPPTCRFRPTCSQYAVEAVRNRGVLEGSLRSAWRLLRCHPFSEGGWDLPPPPRAAASEAPDDPPAAGPGSEPPAPLSCASPEPRAPSPCESSPPPSSSPSSAPAPAPGPPRR